MAAWAARSVIPTAITPDSRRIALLVTPNHLIIMVQIVHNATPPVIGIHLGHTLVAAMEIVPTIETHPAPIVTRLIIPPTPA